MKLKVKLAKLQVIAPHASEHGQLYKDVADTRKKYRKVTLYTLFVSDENTHLLRDHVFSKKRARSPADWARFFTSDLTDIHREAVLPGLALRTSKQWSVKRILGWRGKVAEHRASNPKVGRRRNTTAHKGK